MADLKRRLSKRAGDGSAGTSGYGAFADLTGDGRIDALDVAAVKQRLSRRLPSALATAAALAAAPQGGAARAPDRRDPSWATGLLYGAAGAPHRAG